MRKLIVLTTVALALLAIGCKKKAEAPPPAPAPVTQATPIAPPAPLAVASVDLGNAISADKKVAAPSAAFGVKDTIYASVETSGAGHAQLRALWSYVKGGKTAKVNETQLEFDASGPAWNEFHIQNAKDWPKGDYQVEIFLGGSPTAAMVKQFKVQ